MILALIRRYKIFFSIGLLILVLQCYLAVKSFSIPSHLVPEKSKESHQLSKIRNQPVKDDEHISNNTFTKDKSSSKQVSHLLHGLNFEPTCDISDVREAVSAVSRAKSQDCKQHIIEVACAIKAETFYPTHLTNSCPSGNFIANRSLGCFKDEKKQRLLSGYYSNFKESNSPKKCMSVCLQSGFLYGGVQYSTECFCGNNEPPVAAKLPDPSCNMKCSGDPKQACGGFYAINVYETGIAKFTPQVAELNPKMKNQPGVRIVFLLTLNGRAIRQVYRLLKALYSPHHFYYIHIDSRQDYMFRELLKLEPKFSNIRLARKRFSTIWGGASLLEMLLASMKDLLNSTWSWDFVLNLSESDFPIKPIEKLAHFLTANKGRNFVKSHGREVQRFIQKQGLDKTFVECDNHMFRIGDRSLPSGIQIDGGSDWICLARPFVEFVTADNLDPLIQGLLIIFKQTLLPAESFFHTAIRNSRFCGTYIDNNLHLTNWKRKLGCKCQYKSVVDWCGCSPNDFKPDDWPRLRATEGKQLFFGRKFEPIVNQMVILQLEEWLYGPYPLEYPNLNHYWQSTYNIEDNSAKPLYLLTAARSLIRINSRSNRAQLFYEPQHILEIADFQENDLYKGFLIRHEARINKNLTVELETWCRPNQTAQVSKSHKLAKKIVQLEVSTDFDQKEQISRNLAKILGPHSEPSVILKMVPSTSDNATVNLTVLWLDPNNSIADTGELSIEDVTISSISFSKSSIKRPLTPGVWTVKLLLKKVLIGQSKFLVIPIDPLDQTKEINQITQSSVTTQHNQIDRLVAGHYVVQDTCVIYSQRTRKYVSGSFLQADEKNKDAGNVHKFVECEKTIWSSRIPDPKSDVNELGR